MTAVQLERRGWIWSAVQTDLAGPDARWGCREGRPSGWHQVSGLVSWSPTIYRGRKGQERYRWGQVRNQKPSEEYIQLNNNIMTKVRLKCIWFRVITRWGTEKVNNTSLWSERTETKGSICFLMINRYLCYTTYNRNPIIYQLAVVLNKCFEDFSWLSNG